MDLRDRGRLGDGQDVNEVLEVLGMLGKLLPTKVGFAEFQRMHHGSHGAVENQDALAE